MKVIDCATGETLGEASLSLINVFVWNLVPLRAYRSAYAQRLWFPVLDDPDWIQFDPDDPDDDARVATIRTVRLEP